MTVKYCASIGFAFNLVCLQCLAADVPPPSSAALPDEIHKACLEARDYEGCIRVKTGAAPIPKADGKRRWQRDDGSLIIFDPSQVVAVKINGAWGRYLKYPYRRNGFDQGSPGYFSPGVQLPGTATTTFTGNQAYTTISPGAQVGAFNIPGRSGGPASALWTVEADCQDYTANWDGDNEGWRNLRGEKADDKMSTLEAKKILDEFCPQMDDLVDRAKQKSPGS